MSTTPPADRDAAGRASSASPAPDASPERAGPPAPGQSEPGPFVTNGRAIPNVAGSHAPGAWRTLTRALGRDLQGGMHRAEQARRRIQRMR